MKSEKGKGVLRLIVLLAVLIGFLYLAFDSMRGNKVKLGLDLASALPIRQRKRIRARRI